MKQSLTIIVFWKLVIVFVVVLCQFFFPPLRDLLRGSTLFLVPIGIFSLLGLVLLILTLKREAAGRLKKFLILTGASSAGFFVFIILHNAFYALNTVTAQIAVLNYLTQAFHVTFFFLAIFVCPIGFLIGAIGAAVLLTKRTK